MKIPKRRLLLIECGMYKHFMLPYLYILCQYYGVTTLEILSIIPEACFDNVEYWKYRPPIDPAW